MTDDSARRSILARRAKFLAAALATVACSKEKEPIVPDRVKEVGPATTATVSTTPDAGPEVEPLPPPMACLKMALPRSDAGDDP